jgi:hypothetical protein
MSAEERKALLQMQKDVAVILDRQAEQARYREVVGRWLLWLAGIAVMLGMGGTTGVIKNEVTNAKQDGTLFEHDQDIAKLKKAVGIK